MSPVLPLTNAKPYHFPRLVREGFLTSWVWVTIHRRALQSLVAVSSQQQPRGETISSQHARAFLGRSPALDNALSQPVCMDAAFGVLSLGLIAMIYQLAVVSTALHLKHGSQI